MAAVAGADIVIIILNFNKGALRLKIFNDLLAARIAIHTAVLAPAVRDMTVVRHNVYDFKIMAQTYFIVVRVVSGSNFNYARTELDINIFIGNNRYFPMNDRENKRFADDILIALVIGVDSNGSIAEHGLRSCGGKLNIAASVLERIAKMPEMTCLILILDLSVRDGGAAVRAPVYHSLALIDESFIIKIYEYFLDRFGTAFVHGKAFPVPIAGRAHFFELFNDP